MKIAAALVAFLAFVFTVIAANWALETYGDVPLGPWLAAPAGVFFAGLALLLRDLLHETANRAVVIAAILVGAGISYLVGADFTLPGGYVPIAAASALAFLFGELADLAVYTPLRGRTLTGSIAASQVAGAVVDSALFLWLAFGSLALLPGQLVGKTLMVIPVLLAIAAYRARRRLVAA